jgi:hypothetical protein
MLFTGCAHQYEYVKGFDEQWKFTDILMPEDCDYIERESFTYICPSWDSFRVGKGVFVGETRCEAVASEYRDSMAKHGSTLMKDTSGGDADAFELVFYHPLRNEKVEVQIYRDVQNFIHVTVLVEPQPRN